MEVGQLGKILGMNIVCLIQARMMSTRLPSKVMMKIRKIPIIEHIMLSLNESSRINQKVVITTTNYQDDILVEYLKKNNYLYFRGSEKDVLERYISAAEKYNADLVVRITADCPLIDPEIVDKVIEKAVKTGADYTSNTIRRTYPDGHDVEVIRYPILKKIHSITTDQADREHVTRYILNNLTKFNIASVETLPSFEHPDWRITLDNIEDFVLIKKIFESFPENHIIKYNDIINLFMEKPELLSINSKYSLYTKTT